MPLMLYPNFAQVNCHTSTPKQTVAGKKAMQPMVYPRAQAPGLPCLLSHRTVDIKAAQRRKAVHINRSIRRLPTIFEAECEDATSISAPTPTCTRPACLPQSVTDPLSLDAAASNADVVVAALKEGNRIERSQLVAWLFQSTPGAVLTLACSEKGSCVVQAALEVSSAKEHSMLLAELQGSVIDLSTSQHGHEVLMRLIEVVPSCSTGFVINEMLGYSKRIARHRHGCHVLNHLIMHFSTPQMANLTEELLQDTIELSKHEHGSCVLQHLLEYGTVASQQRIVQHLLPVVRLLAMNKTASRVLQQVFEHCELSEQAALGSAVLLPATASLTDVACSRCGSAILQRLDEAGLCSEDFRAHLAKGFTRLQKSKYGRRILTALGI